MKKIILLLMVFLVLSCLMTAVDIRKENIKDIKPVLRNASQGICPLSYYSLKFNIITSNGKVISNPDMRHFEVMSPNNTFIIQRATRSSIGLKPNIKTLDIVHKQKEFILSAKIFHNEFKEKTFEFPVSWRNKVHLYYMGSSGKNGRDGSNGEKGSKESPDTVNGKDGEHGTDGMPGKKGDKARLLAAFYDVSDLKVSGIRKKRMLLVVDIDTGKILLTQVRRVFVHASGGPGGNGGSGGRPGKGVTLTTDAGTYTGTKGKFGNGGNGADGAQGGNITLFYSNDKVKDYIMIDVSGGKGGKGGKPNGFFTLALSGNDGKNGKDGEKEYKKISKFKLVQKIKSVSVKGLQLYRIQ